MHRIRHVALHALRRLVDLISAWRAPDPEAGMTTAELLGNAALGIAAVTACTSPARREGVLKPVPARREAVRANRDAVTWAGSGSNAMREVEDQS